jgi:competence protein ComEC
LTHREGQHAAERTWQGLGSAAVVLLLCFACGIQGEPLDAGPDGSADQLEVADDASYPDVIAPGILRVVFFNVGTGDAILVQAPNGRTLLVDLGIPQVVTPGQEAAAARHVADRIEALTGRRGVDYFVASHFHTDHVGNIHFAGDSVGGISWAVQSYGFQVGTFLDRGRAPAGNSSTQGEYLGWVEGLGNHRVVDRSGADWIDLGPDVRVEILAAAGVGVAAPGSGENGFSLPVRVTFGDLELSLAGDLTGICDADTADVESAVAPLMGAVEVYKVNHHGSQSGTNLTWVRALKPQVAVFPLGASEFGYPHDRVVEALAPLAVSYETRDGDVVLESTDGRAYTVNGRAFTARNEGEEAALPVPDIGVDENTNALCGNGRDDDRDGYTDCRDFSCSQCPAVTACP